ADKGRNEAVCRVIVDLRRGSYLTYPPMIDDGNAITHAHCLDLIVGHIDGGDADPLLECLDLQASRCAQFGVEVRERFVEQKRGRLAHERARERDTLAFTAGELARPPIEQMPDAEQLRRPLDFLVDLGARNALRAQWKGDILAHRVMRIEAVALKH